MVRENSTDFACGQILYSLKMSKLNYVVKETPYSAYVTIRKRFIKECENITGNNDDAVKATDDLSQLSSLKEKNKDLEKRIAMAKVDFEEMEIKIESLEKKNSKYDELVENLLQSEKKLNEEIVNLKETNDSLKREKEVISQQFARFKRENKDAVNVKELETNKIMLENVVKARDIEIMSLRNSHIDLEESVTLLENALKCRDQRVYDLKEELKKNKEDVTSLSYSDDDIPTTSKCGTCEYESDSENELKRHIKAKHEDLKKHVCSPHGKMNSVNDKGYKCDVCDLTLKTTGKVKKHICIVKVENPSYGSL